MTVKRMRGFTIVEIFIALALGVMLSSALVQIFSSSRQMSAMETALSRMQETGRFAIETMARDIRMAGYQGCADPSELRTQIHAKKFTDDHLSAKPIIGYEVAADQTFSPALPAGHDLASISGDVRSGSDVISLTYASLDSAELTQNTGNSANVKVDQVPGHLSQGDYVIISDCKSAHLLEITNNPSNTTVTHGGNVNNNHNKLTPGYSAGAQMMSFESRTYYVADTGRTTNSGAPVYALYVRGFDGTSQEILEGVENLQILYGQQLESGQIRYVEASDVVDAANGLEWSQVISVRIGLLVQSFEQVAELDDANSYELPGASISSSGAGAHAGDKALRKPFTATVKLRNRRQKI